MKFIVLVGKDNTGKTTTLKGVIDELIKSGATVIDDKLFYKFGSYVKYISQPVPKQNEITILLAYKGKTIGITTYGDTVEVLQSKIDLFIKIGCTHIICGSHPTGSSYEYMVDLADKYSFKDFHTIFKIGCAGIKKHPNLQKLQDDSDKQAQAEIISLI